MTGLPPAATSSTTVMSTSGRIAAKLYRVADEIEALGSVNLERARAQERLIATVPRDPVAEPATPCGDVIERAAQLFCDSSPEGRIWAEHGEPFRNIYRRQLKVLHDVGHLGDLDASPLPACYDAQAGVGRHDV